MSKQINPLIRAPDIHGEHRRKGEESNSHTIIQKWSPTWDNNEFDGSPSTRSLSRQSSHANGGGNFTGKTYKFDFRFHFHHYLFIMRSSSLATSTTTTTATPMARRGYLILHYTPETVLVHITEQPVSRTWAAANSKQGSSRKSTVRWRWYV